MKMSPFIYITAFRYVARGQSKKTLWTNNVRKFSTICLLVQLFVCYAYSDTTVGILEASAISTSPTSILQDTARGDLVETATSQEDSVNRFDKSASSEMIKRAVESNVTSDSKEAHGVICSTDANTSNVSGSTNETKKYRSSSLAMVKGIDTSSYSCPGDITIGALPIAQQKEGPGSCTPFPSFRTMFHESVMAIRYAVESVNSDPNILPGIKLGFVQLATCTDSNAALSRSLSYLPRVKVTSTQVHADTCGAESGSDPDDVVGNNSTCYSHSSYSPEVETEEEMPFYDVIGVLGPVSSRETVGVARLMGVAKIPVIGVTSTSDELSDKSEYPYFLRVVAPDKYQTEAMLAFVEKHGWSYFSVLYRSGSYGDTAFENIKQIAAEKKLCIAYSYRLESDSDLEEVARGLLAHEKARVVITFIFSQYAIDLLKVLNNFNAAGHFIWLASDAWITYSRVRMKGMEEEAVGSFTFSYQSEFIPDFYKHLSKVMFCYRDNVNTDLEAGCSCSDFDIGRDCVGGDITSRGQEIDLRFFDAVMEDVWSLATSCTSGEDDNKTGSLCVSRSNMSEETLLPRLVTSPSLSHHVDAVRTFAMAVHQLISDLCPGAKGQTARDCITGPVLLQYLRNTSFNGSSGVVKFDDNGDAAGKYVIYQTVIGPKPDPLGLGFDGTADIGLNAEPVAHYDIFAKEIILADKPISWTHLRYVNKTERYGWPSESDGNYDNRSMSGKDGGFQVLTPESVCSKPCQRGEFVIQRNPAPCCWECRTCRDNERLIKDNTTCETCPQFAWPDPLTEFQTCIDIPVTYTRTSGLLPTLQIILGTLALIVCFIIIGFYIYFRESRVIKAASRELSVCQMLASLVGFGCVILFQMPPTKFTCGALYFMFCLSFAWLYCPLLVKAVRIYRIFDSTVKSTRPPRFISPVFQVVVTLTLVAVQVILCLYIFIVYQPTAVRFQPVPTEKFVELSCDLTMPGLTSFLVYNLVLVALCSIFAFKTRKLPDNFNESQFICMCVTTTLVIWGAFVPTYFTSTFGRVRVLLLSITLLLNHIVALVFLFAPKVYAALYVPENSTSARSLPVTRNRFARSEGSHSSVSGRNGNLRPITPSSLATLNTSNNRIFPAPQPRQADD